MIFEFWIFLLFRDGETQIVLQGGNIIFLIFYEKMPSRDLLQKKKKPETEGLFDIYRNYYF